MATATEKAPRSKMQQSSAEFESFRDSEGNLSACSAAAHFWQEYARERPEIVALWCFGLGFMLGWKLKPW